MKLKFILAGIACLGCAAVMQAAAPKVIAHRGYWDTKGSAQNSIRSLVKADSIGCYASEFDVWMTPDSVLIVNHDPTINGIEIQSTPSSIVLQQKLANGENVSTLDEYFKTAQKLNTRLVLELKTHDSRKRETAAIEKVLKMANKYGLEDRLDYIVFSKDAFKQFISKAPKANKVYFLNGDYVPAQIKYAKGAGIDYSLKVMKKHPEWIKDCHNKGLEVNVWTVNDPEDMKWCIEQGVDYITTNDPEGLQKLLK